MEKYFNKINNVKQLVYNLKCPNIRNKLNSVRSSSMLRLGCSLADDSASEDLMFISLGFECADICKLALNEAHLRPAVVLLEFGKKKKERKRKK